MKPGRALGALALVLVLAGVAYVSQRAEPSGAKMTQAAVKFLDNLTPEQRARATFAFDDKERTNWHFVPLQDPARRPTRKGLPLEDMNATQQQAALALLRAGTSASGDQKALTIMSLENILKELEKGGAMVRNPHWYFFTVFGQPSSTGKWGWRVEGHHLCLNFVIDRDKVVAATPAIFGANPAIVLSGPRKGLRTLPEVEDLARDLIKSLDEDQKKVAHQKEQFPEIQQATAHQDVGPPRGLPASKMNAGQLDLLVGLLDSYAHRMKPDVAEVELGQVKEAGIDNLYFAYAGGVGPGQAHTYRIQGPTFVVEFLNVQADSAGNPANHIHSGWFHLKNDLGVE